ncbi:MAG: hypothetical protein ABR95_09510 [Sphingobacteriales bacterium BACL12 MAG-120813-bin55]|jgi:hypothetical protein|nr:MAG: hypothetical protein ABR95_09510 [Sphingobacteriales bacterium BACL12 MAG-120813-bin55]
MKRLVLVFSALLLTAGFFSSCEKCTVCTNFDLATGDEVVEEYCGSGKEVDNFEAEWATKYDSLGGYCQRN